MSVEDYVKQLYWEANPGSKLKNETPFIIATETTLTNNMDYEDGQIRRMNGSSKLKGEGDLTGPQNPLNTLDLSEDSPIHPQDIRTWRIKVDKAEGAQSNKFIQ